MRRLQDWRSLVRSLLFAAVAAGLAWSMVGRHCGTAVPAACLALGAAILVAAYGVLHALSGPGRDWLVSIRQPGRGR